MSMTAIPQYSALIGDDTQRCEALRTIVETRSLQCDEPQAFFSNLVSPNPTVQDLAKKALRALKTRPGLAKALAHYRNHCQNAKQRKLLDDAISEIDNEASPDEGADCRKVA